jgi:hypothetical protein
MTPTYFCDLDDAPQLAAIDILDHVLAVAENAIFSAYPELAAGEGPQCDDLPIWVAEEISGQMRLLRRSIERYKRAVNDRWK